MPEISAIKDILYLVEKTLQKASEHGEATLNLKFTRKGDDLILSSHIYSEIVTYYKEGDTDGNGRE